MTMTDRFPLIASIRLRAEDLHEQLIAAFGGMRSQLQAFERRFTDALQEPEMTRAKREELNQRLVECRRIRERLDDALRSVQASR